TEVITDHDAGEAEHQGEESHGILHLAHLACHVEREVGQQQRRRDQEEGQDGRDPLLKALHALLWRPVILLSRAHRASSNRRPSGYGRCAVIIHSTPRKSDAYYPIAKSGLAYWSYTSFSSVTNYRFEIQATNCCRGRSHEAALRHREALTTT